MYIHLEVFMHYKSSNEKVLENFITQRPEGDICQPGSLTFH